MGHAVSDWRNNCCMCPALYTCTIQAHPPQCPQPEESNQWSRACKIVLALGHYHIFQSLAPQFWPSRVVPKHLRHRPKVHVLHCWVLRYGSFREKKKANVKKVTKRGKKRTCTAPPHLKCNLYDTCLLWYGANPRHRFVALAILNRCSKDSSP